MIAALASADRRQAGLIEQALLGVGEVERAVPRDRPAEAAAELLLRHRQRRARERVRRVEGVVAEEAVGRAAQLVGAAARDHVDVAAERAAEFGLAARRHDLELLHRVDAVGHAAQPRGVVVGRQAVDDEAVREIALAADRQADAGHGRGLGEELRAVDVRRRHARARAARCRGSCGRSAAGCPTSCSGTVAAIWLRADSSTGASALTVTAADTPSTARTTGSRRPRPASARGGASPPRTRGGRRSVRRGRRAGRGTGAAGVVGDDRAVTLCPSAARHGGAGHDGSLRVGDAPAHAGVVDRFLGDRDRSPGEKAHDEQAAKCPRPSGGNHRGSLGNVPGAAGAVYRRRPACARTRRDGSAPVR